MRIRDLRVDLGGNKILKGLNADLTRGQITALLGLNGSGKSTLLRALVKEVPYSGQIAFLCGHDHSRTAPEHVGYVPQKLHIDSNLPLTVIDLFGLSLQWRRPIFFGIRRSLRVLVRNLLTQVGAAHLIDALVEKLSGGEKQRVLLALACSRTRNCCSWTNPPRALIFRKKAASTSCLAS